MAYPNNLKLVETLKDGNCFFHCFELYFDYILEKETKTESIIEIQTEPTIEPKTESIIEPKTEPTEKENEYNKLENLIREKNKITLEIHEEELKREKQQKEHEIKNKKFEYFIDKQLQIDPETQDEKKNLLLRQHNLRFIKSLMAEKLF